MINHCHGKSHGLCSSGDESRRFVRPMISKKKLLKVAVPYRCFILLKRVWVNTYRYIFSGMNIHKSQLFWGSLGTRVLTHPHKIVNLQHFGVLKNPISAEKPSFPPSTAPIARRRDLGHSRTWPSSFQGAIIPWRCSGLTLW